MNVPSVLCVAYAEQLFCLATRWTSQARSAEEMSDTLGLPLLIVIIALPSTCTLLAVIVLMCKTFCDGGDQVAPPMSPAAAPTADPEAGYGADSAASSGGSRPAVPDLPDPESGGAMSALEMPTPASPVAKLPPLGKAATPLPPIGS